MTWRVGGKIPLNVYEDDKPMFQCHTPEDATRVVGLLNGALRTQGALKELHAIVWGECPSLLNEDSGGDARLDCEIRECLRATS